MAKNPFHIAKTTSSKPKDGMHRPEGAGNFDNMDDYNIVQTTSLKQGTIQHVPANDKDIVNKKFVDDENLWELGLFGETQMKTAEILNMQSKKIEGLLTPFSSSDAATKGYVDGQFPVTHASTTGKTTDDHHNESHTIASHSDTTGTGAELDTLTDDSMADVLHRHSELSASDGSPNGKFSMDADGKLSYVIEADGSDFDSYTYSNVNWYDSTSWVSWRARGTEASPLTIANGDRIGIFQFRAYDGTSWNIMASIDAEIEGAVSTGNTPTQLLFKTGEAASRSTRMTIFPDGDIQMGTATDHIMMSSGGAQIFVGNTAGLPYAEIYAKDNTGTITLNSTGTKQQINDFDTDGPFLNVNSSSAGGRGDHIITKPGVYLVMVSLTIENAAGAAHKVDVSVWKNNGATELTNIHAHKDLTAGTDVSSISMSGLCDCATSDSLEVWIDTDRASNSDIIIEDINFTILQVGGT